MISRHLLVDWLARALCFANLSAEAVSDSADDILNQTWKGADMLGSWHAPRDGYVQLQVGWREFLGKVSRTNGRAMDTSDVRALREWVLDAASTDEGFDNFTFDSKGQVLPFIFDEQGRPQIGYVHAARPEGLLSIVGAELLAPDAQFRVWQCANAACGKFHVIDLMARKRGGPRKHCAGCEPISTPRVQKARAKKKNAKATPRRARR